MTVHHLWNSSPLEGAQCFTAVTIKNVNLNFKRLWCKYSPSPGVMTLPPKCLRLVNTWASLQLSPGGKRLARDLLSGLSQGHLVRRRGYLTNLYTVWYQILLQLQLMHLSEKGEKAVATKQQTLTQTHYLYTPPLSIRGMGGHMACSCIHKTLQEDTTGCDNINSTGQSGSVEYNNIHCTTTTTTGWVFMNIITGKVPAGVVHLISPDSS